MAECRHLANREEKTNCPPRGSVGVLIVPKRLGHYKLPGNTDNRRWRSGLSEVQSNILHTLLVVVTVSRKWPQELAWVHRKWIPPPIILNLGPCSERRRCLKSPYFSYLSFIVACWTFQTLPGWTLIRLAVSHWKYHMPSEPVLQRCYFWRTNQLHGSSTVDCFPLCSQCARVCVWECVLNQLIVFCHFSSQCW